MNWIQKAALKIAGLSPDKNQLFRQLYRFHGQNMPIAPQDNKEKLITEGYQYNHLVYAIVSFICRKAAYVDYKAYYYSKGGKKEEASEHPILEPIYHPNNYQGKSEFLEQFHGFKLITGDSYIYQPKLESGINKGRITEQHIMPAHLMEIVSEGMFDPVGGYKLRWGMEQKPFAKEDVMHSKYANYYYQNGSELYGLSPIQAAWGVLQKSNSNTEAGKSSFDNKGAQGILFDKPMADVEQLTEQQALKMQSKWDKKIRGTNNKGRILITSGDLGYIDLGMSPVDLNLLEDNQASQRDICNIYHVPSQLFNDKEASTYNNMKEARKAVWTDAIMPECYSFAEEYSRALGLAYADKGRKIYIEPDTSNIEEMQADMKEMAEWLVNAYWLKGNEKREVMGREEDPEMDKYFIPANLLPSDEPMIDPIEPQKGFDYLK